MSEPYRENERFVRSSVSDTANPLLGNRQVGQLYTDGSLKSRSAVFGVLTSHRNFFCMWELSPLASERVRRYCSPMKRVAPILMFVASLSSLSLFFTGEGDLHALRELQGRLQSATSRNERLQEYVDLLREHNGQMKNDRRFLERAARNELGLVRPGELVFVFEDAGVEAEKVDSREVPPGR